MEEKYKKALEVLQKGGVVVFPTDTVMGVGAAMDKKDAIKKLYEIKRRPVEQPTAVLVNDVKMAKSLIAQDVEDEFVEKVTSRFWPGELTVVVKASEIVPKEIMGGGDAVGIRMPNFFKVQELIRELGVPLVATSANFAGEVNPTKFADISPEFLKLVDYAIEENSSGTTASSVVKYLGDGKVEFIRKGNVSV